MRTSIASSRSVIERSSVGDPLIRRGTVLLDRCAQLVDRLSGDNDRIAVVIDGGPNDFRRGENASW